MRGKKGLCIKIVKDGETLLEIPLEGDRMMSVVGDSVHNLMRGLEKLSKIFDVMSNPIRLKILAKLATEGEQRFVDFVKDLDMNPRIASFNMKKMLEEGLVEKGESGYRISEAGKGCLAICGIGMNKFLKEVEGTKWRRIRVE